MPNLIQISIPQMLAQKDGKRRVDVPYTVLGEQMFLKLASWKELLFLLYTEEPVISKSLRDMPYRLSQKGNPYIWVGLTKPSLYAGRPSGFFVSQDSYAATVYKFISWVFSYHAIPAPQEVLHALTMQAVGSKKYAKYPDAMDVLRRPWEENRGYWRQTYGGDLYEIVPARGYLVGQKPDGELSAIWVSQPPPPKTVLETKLLTPTLALLRGAPAPSDAKKLSF
jgi:hypothetical protein